MKNEELKEILTEVRKALQLEINEGASTEVLMKGTGLTRTIYFKFLNGSYEPKKPAIIKSLIAWHEAWKLEQQNQLLPSVEQFKYIETETAKIIYSDLIYAHDFQDITLIFGGAGIGKTTIIRKYIEDTSNVHLIECTPNNSTKGGVLRAISTALGLRIPRGNADVLEAMIVKNLKGTKSFLIFDEAQFLKLPSIETVRRIHDQTEVGIALAGNEKVRDQMIGTRNAQDYAQLFSRVGKVRKLNKPKKADVLAIIERFKVDKDTQDLCYSISQKAGAIRRLIKVIRIAEKYAGGSVIEPKHLQAGWNNLYPSEPI